MKVKRVLRFYFSAEKLNGALDNLILRHALSPYSDGLKCAERLCALAGEKQTLCELWNYVDRAMQRLTEGDIKVLENYAAARVALTQTQLKQAKRCLIKFRRRAVRLEGFTEAIRLVGEYYCLL